MIDKAIIAENVKVGDNVTLGIGNEAPNKLRSDIYNSGLVTIGENSVIPAGVQIGKNTAISGITVKEDYVQGALESGVQWQRCRSQEATGQLILHSAICPIRTSRR